MIAAFEKDKEAEIELHKEILFQDFYQVWKSKKLLNLCFLIEEKQSEELANGKRRAKEEAAE